MEIKIAVRELVEFILRNGDIDNRRHGGKENAMQEGSRIHRMIQKKMGTEYKAEVSLRYTHEAEGYHLVIEGRADGIIEKNDEIVIDEIKGTYLDLKYIKKPSLLHLAQAKCYGCIYLIQKELEKISIQMTYCNFETEEIKYFKEEFQSKELRAWFQELVQSYLKWSDFRMKWKEKRINSIEKLEFPFEYRKGQKELISYVYQTIYHKKKLFVEAPTGVGKTVSTIFPAIKSMEKGRGEKLFYLTAKTITRTVAEKTIELLREKGLAFKSFILTAKDKICFLEKAECNPEHCPYAKGHYDRVNDAIFELINTEDSFTRELLESYARKHHICPFEYGLDVSVFADAIIGDYNYLFDPHASLNRFFGDGIEGDYLFLIDEAHNLLERGREMYSACLEKSTFMVLKKKIKLGMKEGNENRGRFYRQGFAKRIEIQLEKCNKEFLSLKRECESFSIVEEIDDLVQPLLRLFSVIESYFEEQDDTIGELKEEVLELYFKLAHFLDIYERVDEKYVKYTQRNEDGEFMVKLFCMDPSTNLKECMNKGRSSILFSATFLPIQYYKSLLGGEIDDYEVYAESIFDSEKRGLYIASDVTTKYTRRSKIEFYNIAKYIDEIVKNRHGNYMVFFPSYALMEEIYYIYMDNFKKENTDCIIQSAFMNEEEREQFINRFHGNNTLNIQENIHITIEEEDNILIGFCVLGGIFSEGIDLKNDSLIGVIIVGTGLPQVCFERELLKDYFNQNRGNGFDYAYRFPGMNKVLQAAGRVIRTEEDVGIVHLLDERFLELDNRKLFPKEWEDFKIVTCDSVSKQVEYFWNQWL